MNLTDIIGGLVTGLAGGLFSGFLGVTAGGILVPLLILILGKDQHVAQGISLVAQIVPTSLSGVRNYSQSGHRISMRWLIWLAVGFGVGGCVGALLAVHVSDRALQWCFVGYLVILISIMRLMSSTWRTMVSVHCSKISLSLASVTVRPNLRRMRSAESWIGVSGFLISCAMRRATSPQAEVRWAATRSVMSSSVMM